MFKKLLFFSVLSTLFTSALSAQTYWVNMVDNGVSMSLPVSSDQLCSEAVYRYVQSNLVDAVSCDVMPLPDAINLPT
jgi:hypothetical protein